MGCLENNRRDHFSKRFKTVVKKHFKLDENHALYSFRHTFITKLYRALLENSSPHAAKSELMGITGHASMDALEKYLRISMLNYQMIILIYFNKYGYFYNDKR
ncbi:hypothetical protein [Algibacter sp. L1A34]|uniref:hypothetical protein n=1 Tax=Algibacter sp. L1A34 TaxID=2686365 RepID=UPI00131E4286|nr:hypothetical protein [Algibacter sp. L1A34]